MDIRCTECKLLYETFYICYVFNMIWCERLYFKFSMDHLMPGFVSPLNELWNYKEQGIKETLCAMKLCVPLLYCLEVVLKYFEFVMLFTAGVSTSNLLPHIATSVLVICCLILRLLGYGTR